MKKCAIFSASYYLDDQVLTYKDIPKFIDKFNQNDDSLSFSDIEKLSSILNNISTRMIDRQSLSLEAAVSQVFSDNLSNIIDKSNISVVTGSFSSAIYPISEFVLSSRKNGFNFVNASQFTNTVGNAAASRLCIWYQVTNRVISICNGINSGLDAIINSCDDINYNHSFVALACATEEIGSASLLICKDNKQIDKLKPLAHIKNYESIYVGTENITEYFQNFHTHFNFDPQKTDFYLSGNFNVSNIFINKNYNVKSGLNKEAFSLTSMVNIGKALFEYANENKNDSIIISVDKTGFISTIQIER